jgi:hypothetical protein
MGEGLRREKRRRREKGEQGDVHLALQAAEPRP